MPCSTADAREGIHIIITLGVGAALIRFGVSSGGRTAMAERLDNRLREEREARGWTQAELAARVGVSRKTINTVENPRFHAVDAFSRSSWRGRSNVPVEELFSIASD